MCQTNNKKIKIKEDLICYKVETEYNGNWITPVTGIKLERHKILKAKGFNLFKYTIGRGYFHSFATIEDACELLTYCSFFDHTNFRIAKCIIPARTKTFKGLSQGLFCQLDSFASKKIILTDKVINVSIDDIDILRGNPSETNPVKLRIKSESAALK